MRPGAGAAMTDKIRVLFLAADPLRLGTPLRLDEEARAITEAIQLGSFRDVLELATAWAVRTGDLQTVLLRHRPQIVHFAGHGQESEGIILEDEHGAPKRKIASSCATSSTGCTPFRRRHAARKGNRSGSGVPSPGGEREEAMRSWPFYRGLSGRERGTLRWFLFARGPGERPPRGSPSRKVRSPGVAEPAREAWMRAALREAEKGAAAGEIPVGAVVASPEGRILSRAHNGPSPRTTRPLTPRSSPCAARHAGPATTG